MKKIVLAAAICALGSSLVQAEGLRFTYVDTGLFGGDSNDYDATEARLRVRGNIGVGDVLYFPLSLESTSFESDDEEYSQTDVTMTAGVGARISLSDNFALYGDASLAVQSVSYDYDGGFDDEDEEDDGSGQLLRAGMRLQPISLLELTAELSKRDIGLDSWDEEVRRSLVALQFNISPLFAIGVEHHRDRYTYDYPYYSSDTLATRYLGAYARFSFK